MCATAKFDISSFFQGGKVYLKFSCGSAHYWPLLSKNNHVSIVKIERDPFACCQLSSCHQIANRRLHT